MTQNKNYFILFYFRNRTFLNRVNFRGFKIGSLSHIIISEMGSFEVILERAYVIMPETGGTKVWPTLSGYDLADRDLTAGSDDSHVSPHGGVYIMIRWWYMRDWYMHAKCVNKLSIRLELEETFFQQLNNSSFYTQWSLFRSRLKQTPLPPPPPTTTQPWPFLYLTVNVAVQKPI